MPLLLAIGLPLLALYGIFWVWYTGLRCPLSPGEIERFVIELRACMPVHEHAAMETQVRRVSHGDDGRSFVMHNLVRHRAQACYPQGHPLHGQTSARAADQRYGKAILWPLLLVGSLPVFIARRCGSFIEPEGAQAWHYVAMVRYRSRRDFLRFALHIERSGLTVHKWAAIEHTHIFPVQAMFSLFMLRTLIAGVLLIVGAAAWLLARGLTSL